MEFDFGMSFLFVMGLFLNFLEEEVVSDGFGVKKCFVLNMKKMDGDVEVVIFGIV